MAVAVLGGGRLVPDCEAADVIPFVGAVGNPAGVPAAAGFGAPAEAIAGEAVCCGLSDVTEDVDAGLIERALAIEGAFGEGAEGWAFDASGAEGFELAFVGSTLG